jgi:hypothetical protein
MCASVPYRFGICPVCYKMLYWNGGQKAMLSFILPMAAR